MNSAQIAAGLSSALSSPQAGLAALVQFGTVAAVGTSGANTVDVYLDNSASGAQASATTGLPYMDGYNPAVGDAVVILGGQAGLRTSRVVLGPLAGNSSGGGSTGVPIGAMLPFPVAFSSPAWLLCNGGTFSSATYPALFALLGSTTLPDARGVALMGAGVNGITLGTRDANGHLIAHTHTGAAHSHGHSHGPASGAAFVVSSSSGAAVGTGASAWGTATTDTDATSTTPGAGGSTGTGTANVPPNLGVNVYIRSL